MVLTQCKNVLRGDRLMVDMTTGVSRVELESGKVQGLFTQSGAQDAAVRTRSGSPSPAPGCAAKQNKSITCSLEQAPSG